MRTLLFIYVVMAGAGSGGGAAPREHVWKSQWQYATAFGRPEYCHKAAANLGLKKEEYRCLDATGGVQ